MATPVQVSRTLTREALRSSWEQFLRKYQRQELEAVALAYPEAASIVVPYWQLDRHDTQLAQATLEDPVSSLEAAEAAVGSLETPVEETLKLSVRIERLPDHWRIPVRGLRSEHLGRFIAVQGLVRKASEVRPRLRVGAFECLACGHTQYVEQDQHLTFVEPTGCPQCEKNSKFRFLEKQSSYVDTQRLEIQEAPEGLRGGEQPERLAAYAEGDLCGDIAPGDRVVLNGVLRTQQRRIQGQPATLFDIFLQLNSVEVQQQEFEEVHISDEEVEEILAFSRDPELPQKVVDSLAPSIAGMKMEKQALALQLFGGVGKKLSDGSSIRGDIHVLLVGDPGVAKSQLLRYVTKMAPRSVYTSGKSSSAAGLTAAAVRDEMADGRWTLEAGALVLADKGICAIDEIDKMDKKDQSSMHEAMEQQCYHPSTELWMADGRRVPMGPFVDQLIDEHQDRLVEGKDCEILPVEGLRVHSVDLLTNEADKVPVARVSRHEAPDRFIRIKYSNGREVLVTPEHPIYVAAENGPATQPAATIKAGTWVPAPRKVPNEAAAVALTQEPDVGKERDVQLPDELTGDLAEALGFLTAEGHTYAGSSHEIGFSNTDPKLLERMGDLMERLFGLTSTDAVNAHGTVTQRWVSTKLYRWFHRNFPEIVTTSRSKRIPAAVLGSSEENIRRFLVGAFQGDGSVEPNAVGFATASPGLARDYADALLKLGVASRIHHNRGQDTWKTYVLADSLPFFLREVVQPTDPRHGAVEQLVQRGQETPRHHDVLPTWAARELRELRRLLGLRLTGKFRPHIDEEHGVQVRTVEAQLTELRKRAQEIRTGLAQATTIGDVRTACGWSCRQLAEQMGDATRSTVWYAEQGGYDPDKRARLTQRALRAVERALARFQTRARSLERRGQMRYSRVVEVEEVPNDGDLACPWVYDVTVEPTHTFVGEGVVLHNTISIAKAGIQAELQSRCAILGAANPKFGRFDGNVPIAEQITMPPALMSRFDVIFTLRDKPDADKDRELAEHIMGVHRAGAIGAYREHHEDGMFTAEDADAAWEVIDPPVNQAFLRKYVAYAKRTCFPVLTDAARRKLQDYYVQIRRENQGEDGGPVSLTARQLEALVRLAEASARMRLSNQVEVADSQRAIDIVEYWLRGIAGASGIMDIDLVASGVGHSQRERARILREIIEELQGTATGGAPLDAIVAEAGERGITEADVESTIEMLKRGGTIYSPQAGDRYKLVRE